MSDRLVRSRLRTHLRAAVVVTALVGVLMSCAPPGPEEPEFLPDINLMTDEQVADALEHLADDVRRGYEDPRATAGIPRSQRGNVRNILARLATDAGRAQLVADFREAALTSPHGLPVRDEVGDLGDFGLATSDFTTTGEDPPVTGVRTPPPSGAGTTNDERTVGASVDLGPDSTAPCRAPDGEGTVPLPDDVRSGQLLTPQHDVFTRTTSGIAVGQPGPLVVAGVDPITGAGPGIELRNRGLSQQMRVRIHLEDPKQFGPSALFPLINIRPIGGTAADEFRATVSDAQILCYDGDESRRRGYFDGWVTIPRGEPGFQVIAEVVENDHYFRCTFDNLERCDLALSGFGPQFWAGADRATVHAGAAPLTTAAVLPQSAGAFASAEPDPGGAVPNSLTDTNGDMGDDLEAALHRFLDGQVRSKVDSALSGDLLDIIVVTIQAELSRPLTTDIDLRFDTSASGFTAPDEPPGATGALFVDARVEADVRLNAMALGVQCNNLSGRVEVDLEAHVWADSAGPDTGITPRVDLDATSDTTLDMPLIAWANPVCVLAWGASWAGIGDHFIESGVVDGLNGAFADSITTACAMDRSIFNANGSLVDPSAGVPEHCIKRGSVKKLLEGFDLAEYLPSVTLRGTTIAPLVTNIDNSWCRATGAPVGCTPDQDLFGEDGVGVTADTTLISSLGQALGGPLGGRFRNVFSPSLQSNVSDLTTSHRDADQRVAGLGVVVDPRLVNLALRHLSQGSTTTRDTDGLFDLDLPLPIAGTSVSLTPEVAPMVLGVPTPPPVACPDTCPPSPFPDPPSRPTAAVAAPDFRVALSLGPESGAPIEFSIGATVNAGATHDGRTGRTKPVLDSPQVDIQVVDNCKADYDDAYALSYAVCGRGQAGAGARDPDGAPISLTDLIALVANDVVLPMLTNSIGGIELPSLDGIVPGLNASFTNARFAQRGGHLGLYADLKPTPRVSIASSVDATGDFVRFFPSQLFGVDVGQPTEWIWEVRDGATGQIVSHQVIPFTDDSAVQSPLGSFVEVPSFYVVPGTDPPQIIPTNMGPEKTARATLTLRQANLQITAEAEFKWHPPTPVPPNPCSSGPAPTFLVAAAPVTALAAPAPAPPPGC